MALLAPVLSSLPGIIGGISSIMDYNKHRAAGNGLSARGYSLRKRQGGLLYAGLPPRIVRKGGAMRRKRAVKRYRGGAVHKRRRVHKMRRGRGFASDFISNIPLIGPILGPIGRAIGLGMRRRKLLKGRGLSPMFPATMRRREGMGLLAPAGGRMRKAHYRYVKKGGAIKRVHVRRHKVVRGGYIPYHF